MIDAQIRMLNIRQNKNTGLLKIQHSRSASWITPDWIWRIDGGREGKLDSGATLDILIEKFGLGNFWKV